MSSLVVSLPEINFTDIHKGQSYSELVTIKNVASRMKTIKIIPPTMSSFKLEIQGPLSLSTGITCNIRVTYMCIEYREMHDMILIKCDDGNDVNIKLNAFIRIPELHCESLVNFGIIPNKIECTRMVDIFNDGLMDGRLECDTKDNKSSNGTREGRVIIEPDNIVVKAKSKTTVIIHLIPEKDSVFRQIVNISLIPVISPSTEFKETASEIQTAVDEVVSMFPYRLNTFLDINATIQTPRIRLVPSSTDNVSAVLGEELSVTYNLINESSVRVAFNINPIILNSTSSSKKKAEQNKRRFEYIRFEPKTGVMNPASSMPIKIIYSPQPGTSSEEAIKYRQMLSTWRLAQNVDLDEFIRLIAEYIDKENPQEASFDSKQKDVERAATLVNTLDFGTEHIDKMMSGPNIDFLESLDYNDKRKSMLMETLSKWTDSSQMPTQLYESKNENVEIIEEETNYVDKCKKMIFLANENRNKGIISSGELDVDLLAINRNGTDEARVGYTGGRANGVKQMLNNYILEVTTNVSIACVINSDTSALDEVSNSVSSSRLGQNAQDHTSKPDSNVVFEVSHPLVVQCFIPSIVMTHKELVFGCSKINIFNPGVISSSNQNITSELYRHKKELRRIDFQFRSLSTEDMWCSVSTQAPFRILDSENIIYIRQYQVTTIPVIFNPKTVGVHRGCLCLTFAGTKARLNSSEYVIKVPLEGSAIFEDNERLKAKDNKLAEEMRNFKENLLAEKRERFLLQCVESKKFKKEDDTLKVLSLNKSLLPPDELLLNFDLEHIMSDEAAKYVMLPSDKPSIKLRKMETAVLAAPAPLIESQKRKFVEKIKGKQTQRIIPTEALDSSNCVDGAGNYRTIQSVYTTMVPAKVKQKKEDSNGLSEPDPFTQEELAKEYDLNKVWTMSEQMGREVDSSSLKKVMRINKKLHNYHEPATNMSYSEGQETQKTPQLAKINVLMSESSRRMTSTKFTQGADETLYLNLQTTGKPNDGTVRITILKYFKSLDFDNGDESSQQPGSEVGEERILNPALLNLAQLEQMTRKEIEIFSKGGVHSSNKIYFEKCEQVAPAGSLCTFPFHLELNTPGRYSEQFIVMIDDNINNKVTLCDDPNAKTDVQQLKDHPNVFSVSGFINDCRLKICDDSVTYLDMTRDEIRTPTKVTITSKNVPAGESSIVKKLQIKNPGDVPTNFGCELEMTREVKQENESLSNNMVDIPLSVSPVSGSIPPFSEITITLTWTPKAKPYSISDIQSIDPRNVFKHTMIENYILRFSYSTNAQLDIPVETHLVPSLLCFSQTGEATANGYNSSIRFSRDVSQSMTLNTTRNDRVRENKKYSTELNLNYVNYGSNDAYTFSILNNWESDACYNIVYAGSNLYNIHKANKLPKGISQEDLQALIHFDQPEGLVRAFSGRQLSFTIQPKSTLSENFQVDENYTIIVRGGINLKLRIRFMLSIPKVSIFAQLPVEQTISNDVVPEKPLINFLNTPLYTTMSQDLYFTNSGFSKTVLIIDLDTIETLNARYGTQLNKHLYFLVDAKMEGITINDISGEHFVASSAKGEKNVMISGVPPHVMKDIKKKLINIEKVLNNNFDSLSRHAVFNLTELSQIIKEIKSQETENVSINKEDITNALTILNELILDTEFEAKVGWSNETNDAETLIRMLTSIYGIGKKDAFNQIIQKSHDTEPITVEQYLKADVVDPDDSMLRSGNDSFYKSVTIELNPNETKKLTIVFAPVRDDNLQVSDYLNTKQMNHTELLSLANCKLNVNVVNTTITWPISLLMSVQRPLVYTNVKAINLGILNANTNNIMKGNMQTQKSYVPSNTQTIVLFNNTEIDYSFNIHLEGENSQSSFIIQDSFGVLKSRLGESSPNGFLSQKLLEPSRKDITIILIPYEGYHKSTLVIECDPKVTTNPELRRVVLQIPISCSFQKPYIFIPKVYLPPSPLNTPTGYTGFIYNMGYDDITVTVSGINKDNPDVTHYSIDAALDTLDIPFVLVFPWGRKMNRMLRKLPFNIISISSKPIDYTVSIKLIVMDNSIAGVRETYEVRISGGACNSRIYSEELFANKYNSIKVAISKVPLSDTDGVCKYDKNRVAIESHINNNYFKYNESDTGIDIVGGELRNPLDEGVTPTIETILASNSSGPATLDIMNKIDVLSIDEYNELKLTLRSLNTHSYVYINAAAVKYGIGTDYLTSAETNFVNALYGEVDKSLAKIEEKPKQKPAAGRRVEDLFKHNKSISRSESVVAPISTTTINHNRYTTHSVLFGPTLTYEPSLIGDVLLKVFMHVNNELNGSTEEFNPIPYLPDIPYLACGSTNMKDNAGCNLNFSILDNIVQYIIGSEDDMLTDAIAASEQNSIYNWDVNQYISFINAIAGRRLFNLKGADQKNKFAPHVGSDPANSDAVISFQSILDAITKNGCLVNSIEAIFLETLQEFIDQIVWKFRAKNGIHQSSDGPLWLLNSGATRAMNSILVYIYNANHKQTVYRVISEIIRVFFINRLPISLSQIQQDKNKGQASQSSEEGCVYNRVEALLLQWAEVMRDRACSYLGIKSSFTKLKITNYDVDFTNLLPILSILAEYCPYDRKLYIALVQYYDEMESVANTNNVMENFISNSKPSVVVGKRSVGTYYGNITSSEDMYMNLPDKLSEDDVNHQQDDPLNIQAEVENKNADALLKDLLSSTTKDKIHFLSRLFYVSNLILKTFVKLNFRVKLDQNSLIFMNSANRIILLGLLYNHLLGPGINTMQGELAEMVANNTNNIRTLVMNSDIVVEMESQIGGVKEQKIILNVPTTRRIKAGNNGFVNTYYNVSVKPIYNNGKEEIESLISSSAYKDTHKLFRRAREIDVVGMDGTGRVVIKNYYSKGKKDENDISSDADPSLVLRYSPKFNTTIPTVVTLTRSTNDVTTINTLNVKKPIRFLVLPKCMKIGSTEAITFTSPLYKETQYQIHIDNIAHEDALVTLKFERADDDNTKSVAVDTLFITPASIKTLSKLKANVKDDNQNNTSFDIILPGKGLTLELLHIPLFTRTQKYMLSVVDKIRGIWCKEISLETDTDDIVHYNHSLNDYCNPSISQTLNIPFNNSTLKRLVQQFMNNTGSQTARSPRQTETTGPGLNLSVLVNTMMQEESIKYSVRTNADFIKCPETVVLWNPAKLVEKLKNRSDFTNNTLNFTLKCTEPGIYTGSIKLTSKYDTRVIAVTANIYKKPAAVQIDVETSVNNIIIQKIPITGPPNSIMRLKVMESEINIIDSGISKLQGLLGNASLLNVHDENNTPVHIEFVETKRDEMYRMLDFPSSVQIGPSGRGEFRLRVNPTSVCTFTTKLFITNNLVNVQTSKDEELTFDEVPSPKQSQSKSYYVISVVVKEPKPLDKLSVECRAHEKCDITLNINANADEVSKLIPQQNKGETCCYCVCDVPLMQLQNKVNVAFKGTKMTLELHTSVFSHVCGKTNGRIFIFPDTIPPPPPNKPVTELVLKTNKYLYCDVDFVVRSMHPLNDVPIEISCPVGQTVSSYIPITIADKGLSDGGTIMFSVLLVGEFISGDDTLVVSLNNKGDKTRYCLNYSPISMKKSTTAQQAGQGLLPEHSTANGLVMFNHPTLGSFIFSLKLTPLPPKPQKLPLMQTNLGGRAEIICCNLPVLVSNEQNGVFKAPHPIRSWNWKIIEVQTELKNETSTRSYRSHVSSFRSASFVQPANDSASDDTETAKKQKEEILEALYDDNVRTIEDITISREDQCISDKASDESLTNSMFETIDKKNTSISKVDKQEESRRDKYESLASLGIRTNILSGTNLGEVCGVLQANNFFLKFDSKETDAVSTSMRDTVSIVYNPCRRCTSKAYIRIAPDDSANDELPGMDREYLFVISGSTTKQVPLEAQYFESEWHSQDAKRKVQDDKIFNVVFKNPFCYPIRVNAQLVDPDTDESIPLSNRASRTGSREQRLNTSELRQVTSSNVKSLLQSILRNELSVLNIIAVDRYGENITPRRARTQQSEALQTITLPAECKAIIKLQYTHIFHRKMDAMVLLRMCQEDGQTTRPPTALEPAINSKEYIDFRIPISIDSVIYLVPNTSKNSKDKAVKLVPLSSLTRLSCPARTKIEKTLNVPLTNWASKQLESEYKQGANESYSYGGIIGIEVKALQDVARQMYLDNVTASTREERRPAISSRLINGADTRLPPIDHNDSAEFDLNTDRNYLAMMKEYVASLGNSYFEVSVEVANETDGHEQLSGDIGITVQTTEISTPINSAKNRLPSIDRPSIVMGQKASSYDSIIFGDEVTLLPVTVRFSPTRQNDPTRCFVNLHLSLSDGGIWKYPFAVSSTMPTLRGSRQSKTSEIVIHCKAPGIISRQTLTIRSASNVFEPFTAGFTGHSSSCFNLTPMEGVLSPNGAPLTLELQCKMTGYGGDVRGVILVETKTQQWLFSVRGTLE